MRRCISLSFDAAGKFGDAPLIKIAEDRQRLLRDAYVSAGKWEDVNKIAIKLIRSEFVCVCLVPGMSYLFQPPFVFSFILVTMFLQPGRVVILRFVPGLPLSLGGKQRRSKVGSNSS